MYFFLFIIIYIVSILFGSSPLEAATFAGFAITTIALEDIVSKLGKSEHEK